jgi:rhodanese-related sulfurtransferase
MKKVLKSFILIGVLLLNQSCQKAEEAPETSQTAVFETLKPSPYMTKFKSFTNTATMVDVRTLAEFNAGHRQEAVNIDVNMTDFETKAKQLLDLKKPVFVYCQSGVRSMNAANRLKGLGYLVLYNLDGGYADIKNL